MKAIGGENMDRQTKLGFFLIAIMLLSLSYCPTPQAESKLVVENIKSPDKRLQLVDNYAFIEGRWKRAEGTSKLIRMVRINTVSITCDKMNMTCRETIAQLVTTKDEPWVGNPLLFIDQILYRIFDWSDQTIYAKYSAPVADFELKISIKDKFAERRRRETKARGAETSDPNIFENCTLE